MLYRIAVMEARLGNNDAAIQIAGTVPRLESGQDRFTLLEEIALVQIEKRNYAGARNTARLLPVPVEGIARARLYEKAVRAETRQNGRVEDSLAWINELAEPADKAAALAGAARGLLDRIHPQKPEES